jgi:hypothetical protein
MNPSWPAAGAPAAGQQTQPRPGVDSSNAVAMATSNALTLADHASFLDKPKAAEPDGNGDQEEIPDRPAVGGEHRKAG